MWEPASTYVQHRTVQCMRAHMYSMYVRMCPVRQQLIPTRLHLQKIVECLHYLAFSQEQDLHEEAL